MDFDEDLVLCSPLRPVVLVPRHYLHQDDHNLTHQTLPKYSISFILLHLLSFRSLLKFSCCCSFICSTMSKSIPAATKNRLPLPPPSMVAFLKRKGPAANHTKSSKQVPKTSSSASSASASASSTSVSSTRAPLEGQQLRFHHTTQVCVLAIHLMI